MASTMAESARLGTTTSLARALSACLALAAAGCGAKTFEVLVVDDVLPSGLVSLFAFEDGDGSSIARDTSASGNIAYLMNGPIWTSRGQHGAIELDGTDDFLRVTNPVGVSLSEEVTVMAWVNPDTTSAPYSTVVAVGANATEGFSLNFINGYLNFVSIGKEDLTSATRVAAGAWQHVAAVFAADAGQVKFFKDGTPVGVHPVVEGGIVLPSASAPLLLGSWVAAPPSSLFDGKLDQIRIYGRALSSAEIQQIWLAESSQ
jgi:hypothetical protein